MKYDCHFCNISIKTIDIIYLMTTPYNDYWFCDNCFRRANENTFKLKYGSKFSISCDMCMEKTNGLQILIGKYIFNKTDQTIVLCKKCYNRNIGINIIL